MFDPNIPVNINNFEKNLSKLNTYEQNLCKKGMNTLLNDPRFRNIKSSSLKIMGMKHIMPHFEEKIKMLQNGIKHFERVLSAIYFEDLTMVFLSQLSQHAFYSNSRYQAISSDSSPIFSSFVDQYGEYEKQKIQGEITKNELYLEVLKSLYPFAKDNENIQTLLSYYPILSSVLNGLSLKVDLDAFCLDAVIIKLHYQGKWEKNAHDNLSKRLEDIQFINRTHLPLIDISMLKPISDAMLNMARNIWTNLYQNRIEQYTPKVKHTPQETLTSKKFTSAAQQTDINKKKKTRKNTASPHHPKKALSQEPIAVKEDKEEAIPVEKEPKQHIEATQKHIPFALPDNIHIEEQQLDTPQTPTNNKKLFKMSRAQNKAAKKLVKALSHSIVGLNNEIPILAETHHTMLCKSDIFHLNTTHYNIVYGILQKALSPTVRYDNIITALEYLGIKVEARGNGDYRKLHLPNGRKIFIYRPAAPQVGQLFIAKLSKELFKKWGLAVENLSS